MSNDDRNFSELAKMLASLAERNHNEHERVFSELAELRTSLQLTRDYMAACHELLDIVRTDVDIMRTDVMENRERVGILEAQLASLSRRIDQLFALTGRRPGL